MQMKGGNKRSGSKRGAILFKERRDTVCCYQGDVMLRIGMPVFSEALAQSFKYRGAEQRIWGRLGW
jgi:hypothetical protein